MSVKKKTENNQIEILVVEDSPTQAEQLKYILEMEGYQVTVARNGKEALSLLSKRRPTLVISDIIMPEMDGYQLCRQIRADKDLRSTPVILLTALSDSSDVVKALECGADNFLTKPYEETYLLSRLRYFLINQELRRTDSIHMGLEIFFQGQKFLIDSDRMQILNFLLSTYEAAVKKNRELIEVQEELRNLNGQLEQRVEQRTAELQAEIVERKRAESESQSLAKFPSENPNPIFRISRDGTLLYINEVGLRQLPEWHLQVGQAVPTLLREIVFQSLGNETTQVFDLDHCGRAYSFTAASVVGAGYVNLYALDITERKRAEDRERLAREVLEVLNHNDGATDMIHDILLLVKKSTDFEALGIRLREGDDFPYYETNGFSEEFVQAERFLCAHDETGKIVRDEQGNPMLECMCGNILCGRTDATLPFFTKAGSFWTNSTTDLLASTTEENRQARTRTRCNGEDYESVALIPLRSGHSIIGLLQINDRRPNQFTPEMIHFFEGLGASIGIALSRKKTEEALRQVEENFRRSINESPLGIRVVTIGGETIYVNRALLDIYGYDNIEELKITPVKKRYNAESYAEFKIRREKRQRGENVPPEYEISIVRKNGEVRHLQVFRKEVLWNGELQFQTVYQDITERKRAEQETASLQDQLRQSQKVEAIGQLAGGIAHDFNNLLTIIQGNSQLSLMDLQEGDPLRANIEEIQEAAKRAADLTRQLLAFSRKQILEMRVLDLNQVLQRLDKMLRRVIGEDIDLTMFLPESIWKVKADPGQIEQVIMNLSVNARDAMPEGGKLTIETANVELDKEYAKRHIAVQPGRYVMLSISDTGVGMTPEVRERIFEPFFTTKEKGKGTGLGLSTVYGIVKQSGGNVWVYSEPGQGTTFKIYLPQVDEPLEELKEEVVKEVSRGHETILLVEDEEVVRKLAVRVLKRQGYKVLEATDGGKAFMLCEEFKESIHLILTDVVMPGMSGRKLTDRLKAIHPEIKVLYMSGYTDNAILHHGILEPGTNFIQKPFTIDGLARKVREILDK